MKPYAESCEQNKEPILSVLQETFAEGGDILEIGSGTGQHATFFTDRLPNVIWHTSDLPTNHAGILAWLEESDCERIRPPVALDAQESNWPVSGPFDGVFSANTAHIMGWSAVQGMFAGVGRVLRPGGRFTLYGPFNYGGQYTSDSNARFDQWLHNRDPQSGIRNFEALETLAADAGMALHKDHEMPANNRTLVWWKR